MLTHTHTKARTLQSATVLTDYLSVCRHSQSNFELSQVSQSVSAANKQLLCGHTHTPWHEQQPFTYPFFVGEEVCKAFLAVSFLRMSHRYGKMIFYFFYSFPHAANKLKANKFARQSFKSAFFLNIICHFPFLKLRFFNEVASISVFCSAERLEPLLKITEQA